jgi:hypothetical protein
MKDNLFLIFGFALVVYSIVSSILFGNYYWYSFYVIGAFIFFGSLNLKNKNKTVFTLFFENKLKKIATIYLACSFLGFLLDVIYGRIIGNLWHYPHLFGIWSFIIPVFVYYPFGGLKLYEMFYFFKFKLSKIYKNKSYKISDHIKNFISSLLIFTLILGLLIPVLNFYLNENKNAKELLAIFGALTTFSFDAIIYKLNKDSLLFSILERSKPILTTMLICWIIAALSHEYPNTYSWEWVYNIPFTNLEIFRINVIILTFGWLFLVCVSIRYVDLVLHLLKIK